MDEFLKEYSIKLSAIEAIQITECGNGWVDVVIYTQNHFYPLGNLLYVDAKKAESEIAELMQQSGCVIKTSRDGTYKAERRKSP